MKYLTRTLVFVSLFAFSTLTAFSDDLAKLEGKWSVKKTGNEGQPFTQFLEIKKDKFKFTMVGSNNEIFLYAAGDLKLSKLGPFSAIKFFNIKAGSSADQTELIDDDHEAIYVLDDNTWTLASNFDKKREDRKPSADTYSRVNK